MEVFVMNPVINIVEGNEYILGQISVRTGTEYIVVLNIQGKTIDNGRYGMVRTKYKI